MLLEPLDPLDVGGERLEAREQRDPELDGAAAQDVLVLEFRGAAPNKRLVFDFITTRLRSIAEVLDTSTIVPEYSITKFPF